MSLTDTEWRVLDLLLDPAGRSWGVGELVDAIGSPVSVAEALHALETAGLIDRCAAFVRHRTDLTPLDPHNGTCATPVDVYRGGGIGCSPDGANTFR